MDKKVLIISLVVAILLAALAVFFVWPSLGQVEEQSKKLSSVKDTISVFDKEAAEIENFKKNYDNYLPNLQKISQMFVEPDNLVDFIKFLEKNAEDSGVSIEVLPQVSLEKGAKTATLTISCSGSLSENIRFLEHMERGDYLINVVNFAASNPATGKDGVPKNLADAVKSDFVIEVLTR